MHEEAVPGLRSNAHGNKTWYLEQRGGGVGKYAMHAEGEVEKAQPVTMKNCR